MRRRATLFFCSTALFQKDWPNVVKYLIPVVSFLIGTAAAELIHIHFKTYEKIHWRQIIFVLRDRVFACRRLFAGIL